MKTASLKDLVPPPEGKTGWPWSDALSCADEWLTRRKEWPRLSIVMPSLNQGEFIEESIRSVLLQDYPDLEFMIFDGGSSDGSVDIIRKYEPWLTYWVSKKDRGQSDAINQCLQRSTGRYFNWQNSDDILTPGSLYHAVNALLEHPEAGYVHGYRYTIKANGEIMSSSEDSYGPPTRLAPRVEDSLVNIKPGMQPGCLMDMALVKKAGGMDETMHFVMDADILLKLSVIKPPLYIHERLVLCRYHKATKSHNQWPPSRIDEKIRLVRNIFAMGESSKYLGCRRGMMSSAYRYAAECCGMNDDYIGLAKYLLLDMLNSPFKGWPLRRNVIRYVNQLKGLNKLQQEAEA